jgi:chorismate mutase-like protein
MKLNSNFKYCCLSVCLILASAAFLPSPAKADTKEQLDAYRQKIDQLDRRIVDLLQERARVVAQVGDVKRAANLPVTVPSREQQVIEKAQNLAKEGPLPAEAVGRIYQKLVEEMRNWEGARNGDSNSNSAEPKK